MKIALFTNIYLPHLGGVAKSVKTLEDGCRLLGHEVRVVAPEREGAEESPEVLRVPAIQHFKGSDFCMRLPFPLQIRDFMEDFQPDLIHSHHPFLLGDAALREAWKMQIPAVFTHHTVYERYTHYLPLDSPALKRAVVQLSVEYCNLCDQVIAPSESIARMLQARGVTTPLRTIPTGIDTARFAAGQAARGRASHQIPPAARVIGHVGRLAPEKNLGYLAEAVAACLARHRDWIFLLVGEGEMLPALVAGFEEKGLAGQVRAPGALDGQPLIDAYAAMDGFAFASHSETQGMVLAEAMAAGKPVVALDGPGVREIVAEGRNGRLLAAEAPVAAFAAALERLLTDPAGLAAAGARAAETAAAYDALPCVRAMLETYQDLIARHQHLDKDEVMPWDRLLHAIEIEWELFAAKMSAAAAAVNESNPAAEVKLD
jgi:1,2-diacylglycerol 3-alpha-glucosyltransferase